ncbi:MAG: rhamnulokinase [Clostridia bacterium]|nr:rhamnulokinase [Clostridia bacterium]
MANLKMLAIDLGASSGRGIIGSFDGEKLHLEENHRFPNEPVLVNGTFRWDILRIFHEIKTSIRKTINDNVGIKSIGIDTWGVDYGLIDKNGQLMENPYHYRDTRTDNFEDAFKIVPRSDVYGVTGTQFINFNTLYQLISADKDLLNRAENMLFIPDLLNYFLTGVKATEYTIASTGQLLDAKKRDWAYDLIKKYGIPTNLLGNIVKPGTKLAPLSKAVIDEIGQTDATVINIAAHDTASAVVAVPAKSNDFVYISSGTWSLMGTEIPEPIINDGSAKYDFTNEGGYGNTIRFLKNIMGLWLEQESKRQWEREGEKTTYDELSNAAMASEPFKCFINPDDHSFMAPGNLPKRIAEFCEKTGQYVPQTKGEIIRCIFESLALKYRYTVEQIDELKGTKTPYINIVGGGTKEAPLCRFCASACGRPVYAGPVEATAIGNIAVQAITMGELKDINEARQVVANSFEVVKYEPENTAEWDAAYERFLKLF